MEYKEIIILHSQYHGCWWPGGARSGHGIDRVNTDYTSFSTRRIQFSVHSIMMLLSSYAYMKLFPHPCNRIPWSLVVLAAFSIHSCCMLYHETGLFYHILFCWIDACRPEDTAIYIIFMGHFMTKQRGGQPKISPPMISLSISVDLLPIHHSHQRNRNSVDYYTVSLILILMMQSYHKFAHAMPAQLAWHVPNFDMIASLFFISEKHIFIQDSNYKLMNILWNWFRKFPLRRSVCLFHWISSFTIPTRGTESGQRHVSPSIATHRISQIQEKQLIGNNDNYVSITVFTIHWWIAIRLQ